MYCKRITISGWTSSFRYPAFISGYQPTLPVPPVSTIYGLLSAAAGRWVTPDETAVGYVFASQAVAVDLETSYDLSENLTFKTNVCRREFLYEPRLFLYVRDEALADALLRPRYPLVLGRSSDIAMVEVVEAVDLQTATGKVRLCGTLIPQRLAGSRVMAQALPTHFTEDMPRQALGTQPFAVIDGKGLVIDDEDIPCDDQYGWGVYFHGQ